MGGSISVTSRINESTEFTVYLSFPLAQHPDESTEAFKHLTGRKLVGDIHVLLC